MKSVLFNMWILLLLISVVGGAWDESIIHTTFGPIRGKWMKTIRNLPVIGYLGIPYAQPPVGSLRFQSPQPWDERWTKIRNAVDDGPMCMQLDEHRNPIGSEDCLYLNIFVPQLSNKRILPVLVFVHGGSFNSGSNNSTLYGPDYLLDQEIILITVNYRLGILGFLSSGNEASPGNYGLKDVLGALKWIQENIEDFGGDPNSVTLSGHSSGASLAHHLALSKRSEGLFDKLITQSGSANAPWATHTIQQAKIRFIALAIELGCATNRKIIDFDYSTGDLEDADHQDIIQNDKAIVQCLRELNPEDITTKLSYFQVWRDTYPFCNFGPTIEPESEDAIVTQHPISAIRNEEFLDIPWITGVVSDEGLIMSMMVAYVDGLKEDLEANFMNISPIFFEMEEIITNSTVFATEIKNFYFPDGNNENDTEQYDNNMTALAGDALIYYWSSEAIAEQFSRMNSSIYFYVFSYEGTFSSTFEYDSSGHYGVSHSDELNYLFPVLNNYFTDLQLYNTANDTTMINIMTEMWSSFVKTGIPSARLSPDWEPYEEHFRFMKFGMGRSPDISMDEDFLSDRMTFWYFLINSTSVPREKLFPNFNQDEITQDNNSDLSTSVSSTSSPSSTSSSSTTSSINLSSLSNISYHQTLSLCFIFYLIF